MIAPSTATTDAELLEAATGTGPEAEEAWRELYGRLNPGLKNWLRANTSATAADVEDIAAEAWTRLYRHGHRHDPRQSSVRSYLVMIAARLASNLHRDNGRNPVAGTFDEFAGEENDGSAWLEGAADPAPNGPADSFERRRTIQALDEALNELGPKLRPVAESRIEGHTYREIADELGIPFGTVKSRCHRVRQQLRDELERRDVEVGEVTAA